MPFKKWPGIARKYSNVHQDVKILHHACLVLQDRTGKFSVPWDKIAIEIPITTVLDQQCINGRKAILLSMHRVASDYPLSNLNH